ncbi:MAG: DUF362 domain-containing protein [Defluviitaleaceae bacterium]|nr:DUF362 domain-containing protein [Defluviitaleaceae bacterium]
MYLQPNFKVAVKPNLILARAAEDGATTHPEVVEGIILFLKDFGVRDIKIIESAWVGDSTKRAFKVCGYEALGKRYGVELEDLKDDSFTARTYDGLDIQICDEALNTDFLINVPVLKAHCQTLMTCAMKNLKGCIPDAEKRRFHSLGLHKPIAVLNALLKCGYVVVDGICGDLSFEEGGSPVEANRIIAGQDLLLIDSFCAELIGFRPEEVGYMSYGKQIGLGEFFSANMSVVELNSDNKPKIQQRGSRAADRYRKMIEEDGACSACYAALIFALHRQGENPARKISIGQGFKGKKGDGLGIGSCTRGFTRCVECCPPKAADIIDGL